MLRVGPTAKLPDVLRYLGHDPEEVLQGSGVLLSSFDSCDTPIPFRTQCAVIEHCARRIACPQLGLLIGARCELRALGALGLLQKYSLDVGAALRALIRYQRYQVLEARIELHDDGETASLAYCIDDAVVAARTHLEDGVLTALCVVLRELLGHEWSPLAVSFVHAAPADPQPYHSVFGCPLAFACDANRLTLRASDLNRRLGRYDPDLYDYMRGQLESFVTPGADYALQVRMLLQAIIPTGGVCAEQIASLLNVHTRTLHRRLRDCGTSFQQLLDVARYAMALRLLTQKRMTVGKVAEALGYSEPSAFVRAFRRWSGVSPGEWRHGAESPSASI